MSSSSRSVPPQPISPTTPAMLAKQKGEIHTFRKHRHPGIIKQWFTTDNPFEQQFGYHRAVRKGPLIFVSGTTALKDVEPLPPQNKKGGKSSVARPRPTSSSQPAGAGTAAVETTDSHDLEDQSPFDSAPPAYEPYDIGLSDSFPRDQKQPVEEHEEIPQQPTEPGSWGKSGLRKSPSQTQPPNDQDSSSREIPIEQPIATSKVHFPTNARMQAELAMERCVDAVKRLGGHREDIVRVKMFVSRHEDCGAVGEAYKAYFGVVDPTAYGDSSVTNDAAGVGAAATMIVVQNGFVDPDILVEVEVDAVVTDTWPRSFGVS